MRAAVGVDRAVRVRAADVEDVDPLDLGQLDELDAVRRQELADEPRRLAPRVRLELIACRDWRSSAFAHGWKGTLTSIARPSSGRRRRRAATRLFPRASRRRAERVPSARAAPDRRRRRVRGPPWRGRAPRPCGTPTWTPPPRPPRPCGAPGPAATQPRTASSPRRRMPPVESDSRIWCLRHDGAGAVDRLLSAQHQGVRVVRLLADVLEQLGARFPTQVHAALIGRGQRTRIVEGVLRISWSRNRCA